MLPVEQRGIAPVPAPERWARPRQLFWIWFAGNLSVVSVVLGAIVMSYRLSLGQGLLVAAVGAGSFYLVGWVAVPGSRRGVPTMVLSRAIFGTRGNTLPSLISWLNMVGWETVSVVTAALAVESGLALALRQTPAPALAAVALAVVFGAAFLTAFLGYHAIVRIHTVIAYVFGFLTLLAMAVLLPHIAWARLWSAPAGAWLTGVVPAASIVVAGTGLSWVNTGADYSRYLPADLPAAPVVAATAWGGLVPTGFLVAFGVLLYASHPQLATAANPVAVIAAALPPWMALPYLAAAAAGMVAADVLNIYSAGLSLQAAGVRIPRTRTVLADAVVSAAGSWFIVFVAQDFLNTLEAFLTILAAALAPWAALFLADRTRALAPPSPGIRWSAVGLWLAGFVVAMLFTSTPLFSGPLAVGVFAGSNLGFLIGFAVTFMAAIAARGFGGRPSAG
jgi:NCS1 family nucleobase:cation symporter-1